jgi:antitoxin component of RelBE/YafQ-DinJ toxin-antitoxin module
MQETLLTIRIDAKLKEAAKKKAEKMGLNLSLITKLFYSSFVEKNNIIKIDTEAIFDEAIKSEPVKKQLIKIAELAKKKYG